MLTFEQLIRCRSSSFCTNRQREQQQLRVRGVQPPRQAAYSQHKLGIDM